MLNFFQKKMNKKGFTLIELIIVIAILAILVALLAPNVIKYLEKSRVSKDRNALDAVYTVLKAELMDENIYGYNTADKWVALSTLSTEVTSPATEEDYLVNHLFFGNNPALDEKYAGTDIFGAKAAKGGSILIYVDDGANSQCGVAGVTVKEGATTLVTYDDAAYYCGNLDTAPTAIAATDCTLS